MSDLWPSVQTTPYSLTGELYNQDKTIFIQMVTCCSNIVYGTTVHYSLQRRSHIVLIVTMATQMSWPPKWVDHLDKPPTVAWLETYGWLSWLYLEYSNPEACPGTMFTLACSSVFIQYNTRKQKSTKNGEGLGTPITWMTFGGREVDVGGALPICQLVCSKR